MRRKLKNKIRVRIFHSQDFFLREKTAQFVDVETYVDSDTPSFRLCSFSLKKLKKQYIK